MLSRRSFIQATGAGTFVTGLIGASSPDEVVAAEAPQSPAAQRPNLLFMLVDNLGYGELGIWRRRHARRADSTHRQAGE
jgi:hypothetical protein